MRTEYALLAIFTLAEHHKGNLISIIKLARGNHILKRFFEHVMLDLRSLCWGQGVAGKCEGYHLSKQSRQITIGESMRYFDGYLAHLACVSLGEYPSCFQESTGRFQGVALKACNLLSDLMGRTTLADVQQVFTCHRLETN